METENYDLEKLDYDFNIELDYMYGNKKIHSKMESYIREIGYSETDLDCYQGNGLNLLVSSPRRECTKDQLEIIDREGKLEGYEIFSGKVTMCQKIVKVKQPEKPKLKRCEQGENPGDNYSNCCPSLEYDTYILKKYLKSKNISKHDFWDTFSRYSIKQREILLPKIVKNIEKQNLKTETKKEIIIPIDKPLNVEQMGLLESTIFGSFVIVKNLIK